MVDRVRVEFTLVQRGWSYTRVRQRGLPNSISFYAGDVSGVDLVTNALINENEGTT